MISSRRWLFRSATSVRSITSFGTSPSTPALISCSEPMIEVSADHKRLLQVMTNLLSNAAKFSPEGEVVEITTEEQADWLRVAVHDRGPGIPEAFRPRVFGRFNQADSTASRQKGGTGLGLAICKRMVEMMHGRIGFQDREGGGTTFWFELPRHA